MRAWEFEDRSSEDSARSYWYGRKSTKSTSSTTKPKSIVYDHGDDKHTDSAKSYWYKNTTAPKQDNYKIDSKNLRSDIIKNVLKNPDKILNKNNYDNLVISFYKHDLSIAKKWIEYGNRVRQHLVIDI